MPNTTKTPPPKPEPAKKTETTTKTPPKPTAPKKAAATKPATSPVKRARKPATGKAAGLMAAASGAPTAASVLPLDAIDPNHFTNPRGAVDLKSPEFAELVASIKELGVLQPVVVGPALVKGGKHPLLAGWRRYAATRAAGEKSIPVRQVTEIREAGDALVAAIAENVARQDMSPLAEAHALQALMEEHGLTQVAAGRKIGMSERTARDRLQMIAVEQVSPVVAQAMSDQVVPAKAVAWVAKLARIAPAAAEKLLAYAASDNGNFSTSDLASKDYADELIDEATNERGEEPMLWDVVWCRSGLPLGAEAQKAYDKLEAHFRHTVRFDGTDLPDQLLADGVAVKSPSGGVYIAGPHAALDAAVLERIADVQRQQEQQAADRKAAQSAPAKPAELTPEQKAAAEEERKATAASRKRLEERHAWAEKANRELVDALLGITASTIPASEGMRFLLDVVNDGPPDLNHIVSLGLGAVDERFAEGAPAREAVDLASEAGWNDHVALAVRAYACCFLLDRSVTLGNTRHFAMRVREIESARTAAAIAGVAVNLPERCGRIVEAREVYWKELAAWKQLPRTRRTLLELDEAADGLDLATLNQRAGSYCRGNYNLHSSMEASGHAVQVDVQKHDVQTLADHGLVKLKETEDDDGVIHTYVTITAAGKTELAKPLPAEPEIEDIDPPGAPPVDSTPKIELGKDAKAALKILEANPGGRTVSEIAAAINRPQSALYKLLPALAKAGLCHADGRTWHAGAAS